uniref:DUF1279 domain-containing protein n=1 Tax=Chaetoceros debilis TaxID=122233 RepID=A0A7S3PU42_9STRA|mmetsp:Transcript_29583/g.45163  ORF Transcript_29583/g.45163 Transcript_29583/m.45163 type:complete len:209 (+) Transcript_29583:164-790(+)
MFCLSSQRSLLSASRSSLRKVVGAALGANSNQNIHLISNINGGIPGGSEIISPRYFSIMLKEEEDQEKLRVESLSKFEKEMELRDLDKQLSKLNTLRGINTGELYTIRGKFKALARDYGMPFMAWYWCVWMSTAALTYGAIEAGGIDAMALIAKSDTYTGFDLHSKVDPTMGTIGITLVFNEMLEPLRLPIVVVTTKPVVDTIFPKNY